MATERVVVCTGWSPQGWGVYGEKFLQAFDRFWPTDVGLYVWGEDYPPTYHGVQNRRVLHFGQLGTIPMWSNYEARHQASPRARGREPNDSWKERDRALGYSWRFDAFKWARQAFIPWFADTILEDADILIWSDADVITHSPVKILELLALLPQNKHFAYLGRGAKHPDIAFQMYRRGGYATDFLNAWMDLYASDKVFDLPEWHSAWTWKYILERDGYGDLAVDLTPGGHGHVWHQSPLRVWGDHLKGDRKYAGRSPERR
jgi:hypothetical protein